MNTSIKDQIRVIQYVRGAKGFTKKQRNTLNDAGSTIAGWGFLRASMLNRIKQLKNSPELKRRNYPASVEINAPLALIQCQMVAELRTLERIAGVTKQTKIPTR